MKIKDKSDNKVFRKMKKTEFKQCNGVNLFQGFVYEKAY